MADESGFYEEGVLDLFVNLYPNSGFYNKIGELDHFQFNWDSVCISFFRSWCHTNLASKTAIPQSIIIIFKITDNVMATSHNRIDS